MSGFQVGQHVSLNVCMYASDIVHACRCACVCARACVRAFVRACVCGDNLYGKFFYSAFAVDVR